MVVSSKSNDDGLVYNIKLSSVGPGRVTGTDVVYEPTALDLAMKLHYLRAVYLFDKEAAEGVTIAAIKEAMFTWFNHYYHVCGRFRRNDAGRPYIKCNDCGARFVDGQSDKTVEELAELLREDPSLDKFLAYQQVIGPEIQFSPPVFLQVTRLKCGGMSLGMSWAHVLGDPFSASELINMLGRIMARFKSHGDGLISKPSSNLEKTPKVITTEQDGPPLSVKRVDPVGDLWITANDLKMETFSFHISASQVARLQEKVSPITPPFEAICATIWQSVARAKGELEPKVVTICKNDPASRNVNVLSNAQMISTVKVDFPVADADLKELAELMLDGVVDERSLIEREVEKDDGVSDFVLYGANLTFVDLGGAELYSLEVNMHKPVSLSYTIQGVGDKGAVLVLPVSERDDEGKVVTLTLPENDMLGLKSELKRHGLLLETSLA